MNNKYCIFILLFILFVSKTHATPDRIRYVLDRFIGLNGINIIVHQYIFDNLQTHNSGLEEEYIIEKYMENGKTTIIKQIKITEKDNIEKILQKEYKGKIHYIFPDIHFYYYNIQPKINEGYIEIPSEINTRYYLKDHIPKELLKCKILRIVDIYYINEYIYLIIDLEDGITTYRKVLMIKYA
jgi:hypothetical protein